MKFRDFLKEKFADNISGWEFFLNPNRREILDTMKRSNNGSIRFGFTKKGDVYIWGGDLLHTLASEYLKSKGIEIVAGASYDKFYNKIQIDQTTPLYASHFEGWFKYKKKKEILKKLHSYLPKIKTVNIYYKGDYDIKDLINDPELYNK